MGRAGGLDHRARSPARRRGPQKGAPDGEPADHAIGRSRGGLTTKIHLAADGSCRPLAFHLTAGQAGDAPAFTQVMARLRVPRRRGRPRTRPDVVLADKAYSSRAVREHLRKRGTRAVIPVPADQQAHRQRRGSHGGRPPAFDRDAYKQRNTVERRINRLKQWRGIATRYEKTATNYLAGLHIAGIFIWSAR
ncbi:IS5 family transposase [Streptomyces sp. IBSBF 2953]|nr:IS5 family transposase [Streptomyces hayashii]